MKIYDTLSSDTPLIVTIGNFDGVHLGHQHVLQKVVSLAKQQHRLSGAITFKNTPIEVLRPSTPVENLCSLNQKIELIERLGIDSLFLLEFTKDFSLQTPEEFLAKLPISHLILGHDARFGKDREGDKDLVLALSKELGFNVEYLPPFALNGQIISSSAIRNLIKEGRLNEAKQMLGRTYSIRSIVTKGTGTGKRIGFPTANVEVKNTCLPPLGVWAVRVKLDSGFHGGVANLGFAPTVRKDAAPILEVHLFDHENLLYDHEIEVFFEHFLREERRFDSLESLKEQIAKDVSLAKLITEETFSADSP